MRQLTNGQVAQRIYNSPGEVLIGSLRTPTGLIQVRIPRVVAANILVGLGRNEPSPCWFTIRNGQGYIHVIPAEQGTAADLR